MSSKFLDNTGLSTLWAKIKSTFQTLGNLVTAWGSTPSDTKYPSEKLVKDSLDGKANTTLDNVTAKSLANLYSITDGYASHINKAAGYGLLATIDYSNHGGYSDTNAVFELYDKASNSVFTGKRYLVVNIRNNSSSSGASGSYVYKVTELIQAPVWSRLSLKVYRTDNTNIRIYSLGAGTNYYGSMVCKLVSCTDFSGESKYSKITMHQGAATNTVPSGTEVPISIITEDYETIPDTYRSIIQDISKGSNLIVNGSGTLGTNYNWPGYTFDGSECYHGSAGSFTHNFCTGTRTHPNRYTTEYVQLDQTKTNEYSVDVKADVTTGGLHIRFTIHLYDIDKNNITAETVMYGAGTTTTLAQDLNPGDTVVHLTSAANWNTSVSQTYQRGFIFWDYANSYGYTYPVETYSRNVYSNWFDSASDVDTTNNTITLNKAWTGPKKLAGTSVSKCSSGSTYVYLSSYNATPTSETGWKTLTGVITASTFRAGTAFVKFGWINDGYDATSVSRIHFTNVRVSERAVTAAKLSTARKLAVSLSNINTDTSFDGSADVTNIKTTGTLDVGHGGTGGTTQKAAEYNICNPDEVSVTPSDDSYVVFNRTGSASTANGRFQKLKLSYIWNYIKDKISSVLGLTATDYGGNAATATTAAGYTSGGAIDTALQGKATPADITSAIQALDVASQGGDGKYIKAISETDGKISATAETMDTAPTANSTNAVTSGGVKTAVDAKLDKTTHEWNKAIAFSSSGKLCVGKFPMYDSNVTITISTTTSIGFSGTIVIATQNINTSRGGSYSVNVFGDPNGALSSRLKVKYSSGSVNFEVYIDFPPWSKNLIHIQAQSLKAAPTDIATSVESIPDVDLLAVTNKLDAKQDVLGISSGGDAGKFLNQKGAWATPAGTAQVQSDWNQTTTTAVDYIKNKPQNLVQDASYVHTDNNYTTADKNKVDSAIQPGNVGLTDYYDIEVTTSTGGVIDNDTYAAISASITAGRMVYLVESGNPLYRYLDTSNSRLWFYSPFEELAISTTQGTSGHEFTIESKADSVLSQLSENSVQNKVVTAALNEKVPTSRTVNGKALSSDISLTASDVGAVPTSRTVNGQALSSDIRFMYSSLSEISSSLSASSTPQQVIEAMGNNTIAIISVEGGMQLTDVKWGPAKGTSGTLTIVKCSNYRVWIEYNYSDGNYFLGTFNTPNIYWSRIPLCNRVQNPTASWSDPTIGSETVPVYVQGGLIKEGKNRIQAVSSLDTSTMDSNVLYVL